MTINQLLQLILLLGSAGVLSCWIAYQSIIVQDIKKLLKLTEEVVENKQIGYRSTVKRKWRKWMLPFVWIVKEVRQLLNCPYCLGYHFGWIICYFNLNYSLIQSLLLGAIVIVFVELYRKLTI